MTTAARTNATKPKRRFLRFSLRTLLVVMLVVCVVLGRKVEQVRKQREVVAWIEQMGGQVRYDYEIDDNRRRLPNPRPPGPIFLRKLLGDDFFSIVVRVDYIGPEFSDVTPLAGLTNLTSLALISTEVSDVTPLAGLTSLKRLNLEHTEVSDVTPLTGLTSLLELKLGNTHVSKEDYEMLQKALPNCKITLTSSTQITVATPVTVLGSGTAADKATVIRGTH